MTAQRAGSVSIARPIVSGRFISPISLCGGPRVREGRGVHQIVRDDAEADPAVHAVGAMVATATESMSTFEHTDAAFAADAPALSATEPALAFIRAPRRRLRAAPRQAPPVGRRGRRRLFVGAELKPRSPAARSGARPKIVLMPIQRRRSTR